MLERAGTIVHRNATRVEVRLDAVNTCAGCAATGGCGIGPLVNLLRRRPEACVLELAVAADLQVGDRVRVRLAAPSVLRAATVAYGLPLAGIFCGASLAAALAPSAIDGWAAGGALAGLAVGLFLGRRLARQSDSPYLLPVASSVIQAP